MLTVFTRYNVTQKSKPFEIRDRFNKIKECGKVKNVKMRRNGAVACCIMYENEAGLLGMTLKHKNVLVVEKYDNGKWRETRFHER